MNLAIEYVLRSDRCRSMLQLPCSLVLQRKGRPDESLVVSLSESGGSVHVRHWLLPQTTKKDWMPPHKDTVILREEVFSHPAVVVQDYQPIRYQESPYYAATRQRSHFPHSTVQETEYNSCMESFFNSDRHSQARENEVWRVFDRLFVPSATKALYPMARSMLIMERQVVRSACKATWKHWNEWKKTMLDFSGPAPELLYAKTYGTETQPLITD